jgi:major cell surface glycoprotein (TIGR04216 family)
MDPDTGDLLRLFASVVVAVAVLTVCAGTAWAIHGVATRGGDEPTFNPGVGGPHTVVVSETRPVVYQGESNVDFERPDGDRVAPAGLIGAEGEAEGRPLQLPIPRDQATGLYTLDGDPASPGVVVQTPRVTDLSVLNERGFDVTGATVGEDRTLLVAADWNFPEAEDLSLTVRNDRGVDITGEVLTGVSDLSATQQVELQGPYAAYPERVGAAGERGTGTGIEYLQGLGQFTEAELANSSRLQRAFWALDLNEAGPGNVTVTVEGWDRLTTGRASESATFRVVTETDPSLSLAPESATRGQRVQFAVRGSTVGAVHNVVVEADDFRTEAADGRVFQTVNDVIDRGAVDADDDGTAEFAFGTVRIDDATGFGEGRLDTSYLEDTDVDVRVFAAGRNLTDVAADLTDSVDERTLELTEPTLGIDQPAGTYFSGDEVDLRGTASRGIDDVALYVRFDDDWELLDLNEDGTFTGADAVTVAGDGDWEREDVTLSTASPRLSFPGQYRLAVVEADDVRTDGGLPATLSNAELSGATNRQTTLLVEQPRLRIGQTVTLVNDQLAVEDGTVEVRGSAPGLERVLVVMIDERGRVATEQIPVDDEDLFERDDIDLTTGDGQDLTRGRIEGFVLGVGRDNVLGDGRLPGQNRATLGAGEDFVKALSARGLTQAQIRERVLAETVNDTASDDLSIRESFEYTDATTRITAVRPAQLPEGDDVSAIEVGETMVIRGETNRQPEQNRITVAAVGGPAARRLPAVSTDEWGANGTWSVEVDTAGLDPGRYTFEADDGASTDRVRVRIVPPGQRGPLGGAANRTTPTPAPAG